MNTQRRRVIYMTDEEWDLLKAHAQEHKRSISTVIRDMWQLAAEKDPAGPEETQRINAEAGKAKLERAKARGFGGVNLDASESIYDSEGPPPAKTSRAADPFAHLAPADRAYMERKLGGKKK